MRRLALKAFVVTLVSGGVIVLALGAGRRLRRRRGDRPVIGPLTAGALAVGVGMTESWQLALAAGIVVLAVRLFEDYVVIPKVLGDAVGISPLVVLLGRPNAWRLAFLTCR